MKVVIADDEPLARERLRLLLTQLGGIDIVAEVGDGRSALEACAAHDPALVLLDIAMPGIDGLEVARHLSAFEPRPAVVFCTAYDAHALKAFEAAAVDYLVKPVRPERLQAAVERARTFTAGRESAADGEGHGDKRRSHLCARLRGSLRLIPIEEIRYLQAEEKYVVVHHARGEDLVARHELVELRRDLDGHVHAVLRHGDRPLEVSRRCVTQLRDTIRQL